MTAETHVRATRYEVTAVPADVRDHIDACLFALRVEERGTDKWAVTDGVRCLNKSGGWSEEPIPSSRTDHFKRVYRHDLSTAITLARKAALKRRVNGMTVADYVERVRKQRASEAS